MLSIFGNPIPASWRIRALEPRAGSAFSLTRLPPRPGPGRRTLQVDLVAGRVRPAGAEVAVGLLGDEAGPALADGVLQLQQVGAAQLQALLLRREVLAHGVVQVRAALFDVRAQHVRHLPVL